MHLTAGGGVKVSGSRQLPQRLHVLRSARRRRPAGRPAELRWRAEGATCRARAPGRRVDVPVARLCSESSARPGMAPRRWPRRSFRRGVGSKGVEVVGCDSLAAAARTIASCGAAASTGIAPRSGSRAWEYPSASAPQSLGARLARRGRGLALRRLGAYAPNAGWVSSNPFPALPATPREAPPGRPRPQFQPRMRMRSCPVAKKGNAYGCQPPRPHRRRGRRGP
jgi:hypothetical protein